MLVQATLEKHYGSIQDTMGTPNLSYQAWSFLTNSSYSWGDIISQLQAILV